MIAPVIIENPLGWAHIRLIGGWRKTLLIGGVYAMAILVFHILIFRAIRSIPPVSLALFAASAQQVMTFLSAAILLLGGSAAIKKGIHHDFTSDMMTSHRLTAMTGTTAIIGYLTGPTSQILTVSFVNWIACTVLAILAGAPLYVPTMVFVGLACLAMTFWTLSVLLGLSTRGKTSAVPFIVILMMLAYSPIGDILPGLGLLLGKITLQNIGIIAITGSVDFSIFASLFGQLALALTFFIAATRKYTRDDVLAFDPLLSHVLVTLCALLTALGLLFSSASRFLSSSVATPPVHLVASLTVLALVAILLVANAAKLSARWGRRKARDPDLQEPRPLPFWATPLTASLLVFGILAIILSGSASAYFRLGDPREIPTMAAWIVVYFVLAMVTFAGLLRFAYVRSDKALWVIIIGVMVVWGLPPLADLALEVSQDRAPGAPRSLLFTCSPIGGWLVATGVSTANMMFGVAVQTALAIGALLLTRRAKH